MKPSTFIIAILIASWFQIAYSSEIRISTSITDKSAERYIISMSGKIIRGDYDRLLSIMLYKENIPAHISIESPGGDVIEAIKLGRLVRRGLIGASPGMKCNSACALIVFSSIKHDDWDTRKIGLHRPSYDKEYFSGLSLDEAKDKYRELDDYVLAYFSEMGVPNVVSEKIMSTPSNRVEYMTIKEYSELSGIMPPAIEEWLLAQCGAFSEQEEIDLSYAGAYEIVYKSESESRSIFLGQDHHLLEERAKHGKKLSEGYRDYLIRRAQEIDKCERRSIKKEQAKFIEELITENSGREPINPSTLLDPWPAH